MSLVLLFSAIGLALYGAHWKYRRKFPTALRILEADIRRRTYPSGAVGYYFSNKPVPFYVLLFVLIDLNTLHRRKMLDGSLEYVDKKGYIIPDTPEFQAELRRYGRLLDRHFEIHGPESKVTSKVLNQSPFAYYQELYCLRQSTKQPSASDTKPSFS